MTAIAKQVIICDAKRLRPQLPRCRRKFSGQPREPAHHVRERATQRGWARHDGNDYCPAHAGLPGEWWIDAAVAL